jgi:hypothetical protein
LSLFFVGYREFEVAMDSPIPFLKNRKEDMPVAFIPMK